MYRDGEYIGFCVDVLKELKERLKFDFRILEMPSTRNTRESDWDNVLQQLIVGVSQSSYNTI